MFTLRCDCRKDVELATTELNRPVKCPECGREIVCVSAEPLDDDAASADFDATLLVVAGPTREAQLIALGGCPSITVGSAKGNHIVLAAEGIAPTHCQFVRIDFGPSRWQIEDLSGGAGLIINGQEIASHELQNGDTIQIGEYELRYQLAVESPLIDEPDEMPVAAVPGIGKSIHAARREAAITIRVETNGPLCPSCERRLGHGAKICVECGIRVPSGRPLITSEGLDENVVHGNAESAITLASYLMWITPLPIPLASSAYGKFKPLATWTIAAITILVSLWFFFARWNNPDALESLMLWPPRAHDASIVEQEMRDWESKSRDVEFARRTKDVFSPQVTAAAHREELVQWLHEREFHPYQLITHALLHDPESVLGFILHLGGNMLFLIVFGSRVNAIIGNLTTAIVYPLLAVAAALAFLFTCPPDSLSPSVGASGAINGLAGMYLVLFPAHYVYCAVWCRLSLRNLYMKVFAVRGFWILLLYFVYDVAVVSLDSQGHTAHWAHIGGFLTGFLIGVALLMSRMFNCRNGDLLSFILGRHAWLLIGKPARWGTSPTSL